MKLKNIQEEIRQKVIGRPMSTERAHQDIVFPAIDENFRELEERVDLLIKITKEMTEQIIRLSAWCTGVPEEEFTQAMKLNQ